MHDGSFSTSSASIPDSKPECLGDSSISFPCAASCEYSKTRLKSSDVCCDESQTEISELIDVRMVDFEHTTYGGAKFEVKHHEGPDAGYLKGIENLIQMLCELQETVVKT